jgi:DNA-binding IclR family transcriptional regulator
MTIKPHGPRLHVLVSLYKRPGQKLKEIWQPMRYALSTVSTALSWLKSDERVSQDETGKYWLTAKGLADVEDWLK